MSQHGSPPSSPEGGSGDPWAAFGYLVVGVALYGLLGWLLAEWLDLGFLLPVGIVTGAGFGIYLTFAHHGRNRGRNQK